jgi:F-type H+-transporting ATPase subunit alpha
MKTMAAPLRINLAQYRELAVFAQFGSDLDKATADKLSQGERLVETFKQPQNKPLPVEDQVIILFAATNRYLSDITIKDVREFNLKMVSYVKEHYPDIEDDIVNTGELSEENEEILREAIQEFKQHNAGTESDVSNG